MKKLPSKEMFAYFEKYTNTHIGRVRNNIAVLSRGLRKSSIAELLQRAHDHDKSIYGNRERIPFVWKYWKRRCESTPNSFVLPRGVETEILVANDHHWKSNRYYPQYHVSQSAMTDVDIVEMIADMWAKAQENSIGLRTYFNSKVKSRGYDWEDRQLLLINTLIRVCDPHSEVITAKEIDFDSNIGRETREVGDVIAVDSILKMFDQLPTSLGVEAAAPKPAISEYILPLFKLIYAMYPPACKHFYGIEFDEGAAKKLFTSKYAVNMVKEVKGVLSSLKINIPEANEALKKIALYQPNAERAANAEALWDLIDALKVKLYPFLQKQATKDKTKDLDKVLFLKFWKSFQYDEFEENEFNFVAKRINLLGDMKIRALFKSIQRPEVDTHREYLDTLSTIDKFTKELFSSADPTTDELREAERNNPVKYKQWRKEVNAVNKRAKRAVEDIWLDRNLGMVDVKTAAKILASNKIKSPVPEAFEGKVNFASDSSSAMFEYYTVDGIKLLDSPKHKVIMNPKYVPGEDNAYYFKYISPSGNENRVYTDKHNKKGHGKNDQDVLKVGQVIEDLRIAYNEDLEKFKKSNRKRWTIAAIIKLLDLSYCRIGAGKGMSWTKDENGERVRVKTYGIATLEGRDIHPMKGGKVRLDFIGKDSVRNTAVIDDAKFATTLLALKKAVGNKGKIFDIPGEKGSESVHRDRVQEYVRKFGINKIHSIRKYHGTRMFTEWFDSIKDEGWGPKTAVKEFNTAVERIARKLNNKPGTAFEHYILSSCTINFFKHFNTEIPAMWLTSLKRMVDLEDSDEPDEEEED
jgi:hypothetical protein